MDNNRGSISCCKERHNGFSRLLETQEKIHQIKRRQSISLEQIPNNNLAIKGDLNGLIEVLDNNYPINEYMIYMHAVHYNHLHILEYMHENRERICDSLVCSCAALYGNLDILQYLHKMDYEMNEEVASGAAKGGHLNILLWLDEINTPMNMWIYWYAIESNNLEIVKWFKEKEEICTWNEEIFNIAVVKENMEIIEYLYENKCPWSTKTFADAASTGNMQLLEWLYERKCPMNEMLCQAAAYTDNLEIIKWAREKGCEWSWIVTEKAAIKGNLKIFSWLIENECEVNIYSVREAVTNGNLNILKWMYENKLDNLIKNIIIIQSLELCKDPNSKNEVTQWLREINVYDEIIDEYNKLCARYAAEEKDPEVILNSIEAHTKITKNSNDSNGSEYSTILCKQCGECDCCLEDSNNIKINNKELNTSESGILSKLTNIIKFDVYYIYILIKDRLIKIFTQWLR